MPTPAPPPLANPIARAEWFYQERTAPQGRRWRRRIVRIVLGLSLTLGLILAGGEFAGALLERDATPIARFFGALNTLPVTTAILLHFVLMLRTLSLSANSITRERQGNNWDMLVLTGVDARQIVRGKWWATVRRMWRAYLLLAVLRAAVIIWFGASVSREFIIAGLMFYAYSNSTRPPALHVPEPGQFVIAAGCIFAMTMINLPFTAACGVSAISARSRSGVSALIRAIATRALMVIGVGLLLMAASGVVWSRIDRRDERAMFLYFEFNRLAGGVASALLENGSSVGSQLVAYERVTLNAPPSRALSVVLASLGIYALLTWLLLRLAEREAVRQSALPPLA